VVSLPFFAIPAWFFVGRGIDALPRRRRVQRTEVLISAFCAVIFLIMSAGLRFGPANSEQADQELVMWYIARFGWGCPGRHSVRGVVLAAVDEDTWTLSGEVS
jgi:hypothetical protein